MTQSARPDYDAPLDQHAPAAAQVGALCHRQGPAGTEILLVTTSTGRWMIPKGWPMPDKSDGAAARQEAWEEAGVREVAGDETPIGHFLWDKTTDGDNPDMRCDVKVFALAVSQSLDAFPEANRRELRWVPADEAIRMVQHAGLARLIRNIARTQH